MTHTNELTILALASYSIIITAIALEQRRTIEKMKENFQTLRRMTSTNEEDAYERFIREWKGQKNKERG